MYQVEIKISLLFVRYRRGIQTFPVKLFWYCDLDGTSIGVVRQDVKHSNLTSIEQTENTKLRNYIKKSKTLNNFTAVNIICS